MTSHLDREAFYQDDEYSDDDEVEILNECPLCTEEFDVTDRNFNPCRCGYQICIWCWHRLMETAGGRCPNCRRIYDSNNLDFTPPDPTLIQTEKKKKTKKKHVFSRKQLVNVRVIQRNLVYVVGLTLDVAREDVQWLRRPENFGKYGKIMKVVINKSNLSTGSRPTNVKSPTVSAYVTYARKEDAYRCIKAIDSTWLDSKLLRASFGTTKYCAYFLRGIPCTNPDCMYLHDYGDEEDTFNKEDIVLRNGLPVPHNSAKLSQFYPHLDDPSPCEKHYWNYRDSNVAPPDSFEAAYDEDEYGQIQEEDEDIDAHDEDNNYDEHYSDPQQWSSSGEDNDQEEQEANIITNEYAKDPSNFDPNGSILPSTARWGKKSPETKSKKKKKKSKATKQVIPAPVVLPPPLDANNAWNTLSKSKPVSQQPLTPKVATPTPTKPKVAVATKPEPPKPEQVKPPVVVAPVPTVVAKPVEKVQEKPVEKKSQPVIKQEEKSAVIIPPPSAVVNKPKQSEPTKKTNKSKTEEDSVVQETAVVQETTSSEDESTLRESPLPLDLDLPLESEFVFSEKDQIHTPSSTVNQPFGAYAESNLAQGTIPQAYSPHQHVDPLAGNTTANAGLWGASTSPTNQQQIPQPQAHPQQPQPQYGNANSFVQSLMQYGRGGSTDLASQLQQQHHQYLQYYQQPQPMPPGAIDLGDLPWESNPFVEPSRTHSRFGFAKTPTHQGFGTDAWKTAPPVNSDQWGGGNSFNSNELAAYNAPQSSDMQQSLRALLPNVNINFSNNGLANTGAPSESNWGFNQPTPNGAHAHHHQPPSYSINININNHHHTQSYGNNYAYPVPPMANKDPSSTTFSFGGNPFAGESWGFGQNPSNGTMFSKQQPTESPVFSPAQVEPTTFKPEEKPKATTSTSKKSKGKKGKGKN